MLIEVWSDVVCPWCFIGRRRLQSALADFPHADQVQVVHRAFQLQPDAQGVQSTAEHLAEKYALSHGQVRDMQANVCAIADGEGLCYNLEETLSGNTQDAHRLILWAEEQGRGEELLEALYSGYFEKQRSLFSHQDLLSFTDDVGLDHASARKVLESNAYEDQVQQHAVLAAGFGATGVPFFVFDRTYAISGAQPQEAFVQTLQATWQAKQPTSPA